MVSRSFSRAFLASWTLVVEESGRGQPATETLCTSPHAGYFTGNTPLRLSVSLPGKRWSPFSQMRKWAQRGLVSGLGSHRQLVSGKSGTESPSGHPTGLAVVHAVNTRRWGSALWTSHAVLRTQHRRGAHGVLQVCREWARAAPSPAGAALPSSGPRWRCAPSVSPAPAGIHLQLPDPWPGEATVSLPQLPLPASLLYQLSPSPLTGVPPSLMGVTTVRPQDGPNLLPPKMLQS